MRMKGASSSLLQSAYQFCTGVRSEEAPSLTGAGVEEPEPPLEAPKRRTRPPDRHRLATSPLGPGGEPDEPNGKRRRGAGKPRTFGDEAAGSSDGLAPIDLPEADPAADGLLDGVPGDGAGAWHGRQLAEGSPGASTPGSAMREIRARPLDVDKELPLAFVEDESEVVGIDAAPHLLPGYDVLEETRSSEEAESSGGILVPVYTPVEYATQGSNPRDLRLAGHRLEPQGAQAPGRSKGAARTPHYSRARALPWTRSAYESTLCATRRYRRPAHMITHTRPAKEPVEYELDTDDEEWLGGFNAELAAEAEAGPARYLAHTPIAWPGLFMAARGRLRGTTRLTWPWP